MAGVGWAMVLAVCGASAEPKPFSNGPTQTDTDEMSAAGTIGPLPGRRSTVRVGHTRRPIYPVHSSQAVNQTLTHQENGLRISTSPFGRRSRVCSTPSALEPLRGTVRITAKHHYGDRQGSGRRGWSELPYTSCGPQKSCRAFLG